MKCRKCEMGVELKSKKLLIDLFLRKSAIAEKAAAFIRQSITVIYCPSCGSVQMDEKEFSWLRSLIEDKASSDPRGEIKEFFAKD